MKKEFTFGKVDGYNNGRRDCLVSLDFGFQEFSGQEPYFSVCANLWNRLHTDIIWGGQCVDDLKNTYKSLANNKLYCEMYDLWRAYHLKKKSEIPADVVKRIEEILTM